MKSAWTPDTVERERENQNKNSFDGLLSYQQKPASSANASLYAARRTQPCLSGVLRYCSADLIYFGLYGFRTNVICAQ